LVYDENKDSAIQLDEFENFVQEAKDPALNDFSKYHERVFRVIDKNQNGELEIDKIDYLTQILKLPLTKEEFQEALTRFNTTSFTFDQFKSWILTSDLIN
jgi:Ca2+-binding EF-hand superfamily protein